MTRTQGNTSAKSALHRIDQLLADQAEAVRARVVDEEPYGDVAARLRWSPYRL